MSAIGLAVLGHVVQDCILQMGRKLRLTDKERKPVAVTFGEGSSKDEAANRMVVAKLLSTRSISTDVLRASVFKKVGDKKRVFKAGSNVKECHGVLDVRGGRDDRGKSQALEVWEKEYPSRSMEEDDGSPTIVNSNLRECASGCMQRKAKENKESSGFEVVGQENGPGDLCNLGRDINVEILSLVGEPLQNSNDLRLEASSGKSKTGPKKAQLIFKMDRVGENKQQTVLAATTRELSVWG
ncbi:hypothetical protein Drorol1_Dr00021474 [Drosera rotundifolia]